MLHFPTIQPIYDRQLHGASFQEPSLSIMLFFYLLCTFDLIVANSAVISPPSHSQNGTELLNLSRTNATVVEIDPDRTDNASLLGNPIDKDFRTVIHSFPHIKISGKSTYMSILKAMIELSYSEGTHAYTGGTFSFRNYSNVKIRIERITTSSSALQYRYAIWGLFKTALYLTTSKTFTCTSVELYWSGGGRPAWVGIVEIGPDHLPDVVASTEVRNLMGTGQRAETPSNYPDGAHSTSIEDEETDLAAFTGNVEKISVKAELQGQTLSIPQVFMTLLLGLLHIAAFGAADPVHDFKVQDLLTKTELVYENYDTPRTSPPFFTYGVAARALAYVLRYMFAQSRFEAVIFVLEVDGTPVGIGHLRMFSGTPSIASDKF